MIIIIIITASVYKTTVPYATCIWQEFSLAVDWPSPVGGHIIIASLTSLLLLIGLQRSLNVNTGGCKATPPKRKIQVTIILWYNSSHSKNSYSNVVRNNLKS